MIINTVRSNCANGEVHLVNGTTAYEGRVEICYGGVWGSVCDSGWGYRDAAIVCLQLGYQGTSIYYIAIFTNANKTAFHDIVWQMQQLFQTRFLVMEQGLII